MVRGAERHPGSLGDVAHGCRLEAAFAKEGQRGAEDAGGRVGPLGGREIEHVQLFPRLPGKSIEMLNMFESLGPALLRCCVGALPREQNAPATRNAPMHTP